MIAQTLDLVNGFLPDVVLEGNIAGNHVPAKHKFLPNHDSEFVADVVEIIGLVVTAAPFTNHIHVRVTGGLQDIAMNLGSHAVGKAVERNNVRSFGENGNTVYHKLETLSPFIGNAAQNYGSQACFGFGPGCNFSTHADRSGKTVTVLCAVAHRIPKLGCGNPQRKRNAIDSGIELQRLVSISSLRSSQFIVSQRKSSGCHPASFNLEFR